MNRKALGRGLGALLGSERSVSTGPDALEIDLDLIDPGSMQPRTRFDDESLERLSESIKEHGIVQPILVRSRRGRYELIAGERRWRAAQKAGLSTIPAVVKEVPDSDLLEIALTENIQREDLNPIEEAHAYKKLIETVGLTQEAVATRFGRDRSYITNYLRLLKLPDDIQKLVEDGRLSTGHARTVLGLPHADQQRRLVRQVIERELSVRATEALVRRSLGEGDAPKAQVKGRIEDPNVKAAENKLRRVLSTQVKINQASANGPGKIEINFVDTSDLDRIYQLIMKTAVEM